MNNTHTAFDQSDRRTLERSGIAATIAASPDMRFDSEEDASLILPESSIMSRARPMTATIRS